MRAPALVALGALALGVVPAMAAPPTPKGIAVNEREGPPSAPQPPAPELPRIAVEAAQHYLIGFPLVVSVTFENRSGTSEMTRLPNPYLWATPDEGLGVRLVPIRGGAAAQVQPVRLDPQRQGLTLKPGESHRTAYDVTNFGLTLQPGVYQLSLRVLRAEVEAESAPVTVELLAPSPDDAREAARVRSLGLGPGQTDRGQWRPTLIAYRSTITLSPALSAEAAQQIALHLFLHRAFFGPDTAAALDPRRLDPIASPSLQAEVAALRLELLASRRDPGASRLRQDLVARWPGLRHRVESIDAGRGFVSHARKALGAESLWMSRVPSMPYVP